MNRLRHVMLMTAAAATMGMGAASSAHADTFASSILDISNFRLLHTNGTGFVASDFSLLTGTNDAHATAGKDGLFSNGALSVPLSGGSPNVNQQCVGSCFPITSDIYTPFASPPPGNFGYADQNLTGSAIAAAGAHAQTRADASLHSVAGQASGNSDVGTSTTFRLNTSGAGTMRVAFDATPFTQAFVNDATNPSSANARLSWSISVIDLTTGTYVMSYSPEALNSLSNVSRSNGFIGTSTYAPGTMSLSADSTLMLNTTDLYQITVQHNTLGNVLAAVPEPSNVAMMGLGLLGLLLVSRRKSGK